MCLFSTSPNAPAPILLQYQKLINYDRHGKAMHPKNRRYVLLHVVYWRIYLFYRIAVTHDFIPDRRFVLGERYSLPC
jgi:hypothetical protein